MRSWTLPILLALLVAAGWHWQKDCRAWLLGNENAFSRSLILEESARLQFRGGSMLDLESTAMKHLHVNQAIRQRRLNDATFQSDIQEGLQREMLAWRRQWEKDGDRNQRLIGQELTEKDMENRVREEILDQAWIERQIVEETRVTESELKEAFKTRRDQLQIPQGYRVAHLFLSAHSPAIKDRSSEIKTLHQRLLNGEPWEALVQSRSEDARSKARAGDLGWMTTQRIPPEFIATLERLKVNEVSQPIKTRLGWHLIKWMGYHAARQPTLKEIRPELAAQLAQEKCTATLRQLESVEPTSIRR